MKITYKNHVIEVEPTQEYTWRPVRYCFSIDGQYEFKATSKCSNRRLLKFVSIKGAQNAAKRLIDENAIHRTMNPRETTKFR